jgi:hypothetical protein
LVFSLLLQLVLFLCSTGAAKPSNLQAHDLNLKVVRCGDFLLQALEGGTGKFLDLSTLKTSQMQMVVLGSNLVIMFLAVQMHEIQFIDQAQPLQQLDGPVDRRPVDVGIAPARLIEKARRVQMLLGVLDGFDKSAPLRSQAYSFGFHLIQQFTAPKQSRLQLRLIRNVLEQIQYTTHLVHVQECNEKFIQIMSLQHLPSDKLASASAALI